MSAARGVIVAVDVGTVRVGVAACDPSRILASPVDTLSRDVSGGTDLRSLAAIGASTTDDIAGSAGAQAVLDTVGAVEVVVGLPRTLAGRDGPSVRMARDYAALLAPLIDPVPVSLVDERLTTVVATASLRAGGVTGRKQRGMIDQAAAVALLQGVLDGEARA